MKVPEHLELLLCEQDACFDTIYIFTMLARLHHVLRDFSPQHTFLQLLNSQTRINTPHDRHKGASMSLMLCERERVLYFKSEWSLLLVYRIMGEMENGDKCRSWLFNMPLTYSEMTTTSTHDQDSDQNSMHSYQGKERTFTSQSAWLGSLSLKSYGVAATSFKLHHKSSFLPYGTFVSNICVLGSK
jgi:hypothetical protein